MDNEIDFGNDREREDSVQECPECGGEGRSMGFLGKLEWFRCRQCGIEFSNDDAK